MKIKNPIIKDIDIDDLTSENAEPCITVKLELPSVSKPVAKVASPLSAESAEYWKQTCKLVVVNKVTIESITLNIEVGGSTISITISFKYTKKSVKTKCTQTWIEHDQGSI